MRTYGSVEMSGDYWIVKTEPQVRMRLMPVFKGARQTDSTIRIPKTLAFGEDLEWFLIRYPMEMPRWDRAQLQWDATESRASREMGDIYVRGEGLPPDVPMALPLRDYQARAVALANRLPGLLLADSLGLGKTAVGLGLAAMAGNLPAIIVCQTHLQEQWRAQAAKFVPHLKTYIVKKTASYKPPAHNLIIVPYSKLSGWGAFLRDYKTIILDEIQELRHGGSQKSRAARQIAKRCPKRIGLSGTPIYNYGGEIFNVIEAINPGALGSDRDFHEQWCRWDGRRYRVNDPDALGAYLAESHIMLRRRREDVGKELPAINKIVQEVAFDEARMAKLESELKNLARTILSGSFTEKGQATRELDIKLRQATGVCKAPFVADAVAELVDAGERVLLGAWHRECYAVYQKRFREREIKAVLYTGSETPKQKAAAAAEFQAGNIDVLCMSLRSGAGVDGLQEQASIAAFGELDWSPQVHNQFVGRLNRDGQKESVTAIYFVASGGSDPVIASVLGLKADQSDGIVDPGMDRAALAQGTEGSRGLALAKKILAEID